MFDDVCSCRQRLSERMGLVATTITGMGVKDVRFPTSQASDGSDAMNPNPDHSVAYAILYTNTPSLEGRGITFTIGSGTEVVTAAISAFAPLLIGQSIDAIFEDMGGFWRRLVSYSPLRWLGPEKGVVHLAVAAITNALWDLYGKILKQPIWKILAHLSPDQVVRLVDFRYIEDVLTKTEALEILTRSEPGKVVRESLMLDIGYPAYTTSAGWIGYSDVKFQTLLEEKLSLGWRAFKLKVGRDPRDDIRRAEMFREVAGDDVALMFDANQVWDVDEAVRQVGHLARFNPLWIEEPTSPDDILGHAKIARAIAPIGVATGEHCHNRIMFKQLFQAKAISYCQVDACRLGGINEALAVLLMAAKFGIPVCPHAGALGLREVQQHLSIFDYIAVSRSLSGRLLEFSNNYEEAFVSPAQINQGRYLLPRVPGLGVDLHPEAYKKYEYPEGTAWGIPSE